MNERDGVTIIIREAVGLAVGELEHELRLGDHLAGASRIRVVLDCDKVGFIASPVETLSSDSSICISLVIGAAALGSDLWAEYSLVVSLVQLGFEVSSSANATSL